MSRAYKAFTGGLRSVGEKVGAPHGPLWRTAWIVAGIVLLALAAGGSYGVYYCMTPGPFHWYAIVLFCTTVTMILPALIFFSAIYGAKILLCSIRYNALDKPPPIKEGEKTQL